MKHAFFALAFLAALGCKKAPREPPPAPPPVAPSTGAAQKSPHGPGMMDPHALGAKPQVDLAWTAPAGWKEQPPASRMRKAQYQLPGKTPADAAELVVFHFPGTGGNVEDNLARWYGQLKQPDGSDTAKKAQRSRQNVGGLDVTTVWATGTYLKPRSPMAMGGPHDELADHALLAAIVETAGGHWFFKATGPRPTLEAQRAHFDAFVKSIRKK